MFSPADNLTIQKYPNAEESSRDGFSRQA